MLLSIGMFTVQFEKAMMNDKDFNEEIEFWRATASGKYTLEVYESSRMI
jgi:hypothetical protein